MARKNRLFAKLASDVDTSGNLTASALSGDIQLGGGGVDSAGIISLINANDQQRDSAFVSNIINDLPIKFNPIHITANYTFDSGYNGISGGPIIIDSGYTVTVVDSSTWTIV